jgi:hypothetical protein
MSSFLLYFIAGKKNKEGAFRGRCKSMKNAEHSYCRAMRRAEL